MKKMKKDYKTKKTTRLLILLTIMSLMLFGCGSTQAESTTEPEKQEPEVVEEVETTEETPTVQEESETTEETTEVEKQYEAPVSSMIDWETFAAQEDNDDICLAISNETKGTQTVLYGIKNDTTIYPYVKGDMIAIPIREDIQRINYFVTDMEGNIKGEVKNIYWKKDDIEEQKYIEFEIGNEAGYYISIFDQNDEAITFGILPEEILNN